MTTATGIVADWAKIRRRLEGAAGQVYLFVTIEGTKGCPPEIRAKLAHAIDEANTTASREGTGVRSTPPTAMPTAALIDLTWSDDQDGATVAWIDHFAAALQAAGLTPRVRLPSPVSLPRAIGNNMALHPAAYLAYSLTDPMAPLATSTWGVSDDLAAAMTQAAADWVDHDHTQQYFSLGAFPLRLNDADLATLLTTAMRRRPLTSVDAVSIKPPRAWTASLEQNGGAVFGIVADDLPVRDRVDALRAAMLRDPASLDVALIRATRGFPFTWGSMENSRTKFPAIQREADWRYNRHMWSRFVPDAHPVQVLTNDHLERANDLSNWAVTRVAEDRYLVETRDLDAWFAYEGNPPHEVFLNENLLAQARADFGAMILTMDDIHNDPNGWTGGPWPPGRS